MAFKIGMVTIGQSPRVDVVPEIRKLISGDVEIVEKGALDGLTLDEVRQLKPQGANDPLLCTRMKDGTQVEFGESHIIPRMQGKISELNDEDVDLITLICGGKFPKFESSAPMVLLDKLFFGVLSSVTINGRLGVMIPVAEQVELGMEYFNELGCGVEVVPASPYSGSMEEITRAAELLNRQDIDLIIQYCIGYNLEMKKEAQCITRKPVCLLRSVLARYLAELGH